jgi:hypothetical protein
MPQARKKIPDMSPYKVQQRGREWSYQNGRSRKGIRLQPDDPELEYGLESAGVKQV